MTLPDLCVLPHEVGDLASAETLCAPATLRTRVRRWLATSFHSARWIQLANGKFDLVARREVPDSPLLRFEFGATAPREALDLATLISDGFMRTLFFGADQKLIETRGNWVGQLILSANGESCWQAPDGEIAPFRWHDLKPNQGLSQEWRARATDAQIATEIGAMLEDQASDCAFSWTWLGWSPRQRGRVWARAQGDDLDGCERVLRAIVRCDTHWQTEPSRELVFDLGALQRPFSSANSVNGQFYDGARFRDFSASQNRLFALVFERFGLNLNQPMERYSAARYYSHRHGYLWRLPVDLPSQHERLEALLDVRDWLRNKVSSAELDELMSE